MPFIAVLCVLLLFLAAIGQTTFWRAPAPTVWYGHALFVWGVFFLALFLAWPTLKSLGM
jgi:hypothetical protein